MTRAVLTVFTVLLFSYKGHCEDNESTRLKDNDESTKLMDNETVQKFIKQLVGLLNQGTSSLVGANGNALSNYQDTSSYQRPISDFSGLDYSDLGPSRPPFYNRPYRPNFGRPGAPGRPGLFSGDQQGNLGNLLGLLGQGGLQGLGQGQFGQYGSQSYLGQNGQGQFGLGQYGQGGVDTPVPYPYPARPPTNRPYPVGGYQQQSLFGALYSISQYDDLRCVPRLLCEVTAGSKPGGPYYPSYGQNQQTSIVPFLSKDSLVTILTVLNFVDESPFLVFGRAALLGYTARGDSRQCLTAYPLCPRNPDQLVEYLNNHNGGFFRFFNQQLPHIPQYAPFYQNNYQSDLQSSYPNGFYNKHPYRKFKKFTKLYDTENSKKLPQQYADKNQKYFKEPRILYGKENDNKVTFDTLPENDFSFQSGSNEGSFHPESESSNAGHRGGKKLKFQEEPESHYSSGSSEFIGPEVSHSNAHQTFFPSESQNSHTFSFPSAEFDSGSQQPYRTRKPKAMAFPDKTGTGNLVLELDNYGNYVVRKDREEPLLESVNKIKFINEDYNDFSQPFHNRYSKRESKRLYFPEEDKSYIF